MKTDAEDTIATNREVEELQAKLASATKARREAESTRENAVLAKQLQRQIDDEIRNAEDEQKLGELEAAHGLLGRDIAKVTTSEGMIVVKRPHHLIFKRFIEKDKHNSDDLDRLVKPSLLHPSKADFDAMVVALPFTLVKTANAVCELAGISKADVEGK